MAFFTVSALMFARSGLAERRPGHLAVAGVACGLALGTKAVAVLAATHSRVAGRGRVGARAPLPAREAALLAACCAAGFLLLGSLLLRPEPAPLRPPHRSRRLRGPGRAAAASTRALTWSNLVRLGLRVSEPAGLVPPGTRPAALVEPAHARFAEGVRAALAVEARGPQDYLHGTSPEHDGLPIEADITAFGPLFAVAGAPVLLVFALRPPHRSGGECPRLGCCSPTSWERPPCCATTSTSSGSWWGWSAIAAPLLAVLYREGARPVGPLRPTPRWPRSAAGRSALCVAVRAVRPSPAPSPAWHRGERVVPTRPSGRKRRRPVASSIGCRPDSVAFVPSVGDPVYPVFDRVLSRVVRVVRAGSAEGAATVDAADFVLVWGDAQRRDPRGRAAGEARGRGSRSSTCVRCSSS